MRTELSEAQLDMLREVSNIGTGHAATALSQMLQKPVLLHVPRVQSLAISEVPDVVGGAEVLVAGLYFRIFGQAGGNILILFPRDSAVAILQDLLRKEVPSPALLKEIESSALKEVGNVLACSYLNAIGSMLHMVLMPSVPTLAFDMAGAVLDSVLIELSKQGETALLIETEFVSENKLIGRFFLLPDPQSLQAILMRCR